tara:strand:+ start:254 stop:397 length:144 start_codon:yes stop_codon:yes gene_type:complete
MNKPKLYIIHKEKKVFINSLAQLRELQKNTFINKLKRAVLRLLNLKL